MNALERRQVSNVPQVIKIRNEVGNARSDQDVAGMSEKLWKRPSEHFTKIKFEEISEKHYPKKQ